MARWRVALYRDGMRTVRGYMPGLFGLFLAFAASWPAIALDVLVRQGDLASAGAAGWVVPSLEWPDEPAGLALMPPGDSSPEGAMLGRLRAQGTAGGFEGMVYENRDRGHSTFSDGDFPALARLKYDSGLKKRHLDYGLAGRILFPAIVLGNSSTAITSGPYWRSQARQAMTTPIEQARAWLTYANDHLYIYPEHRDYDATDMFPLNWPYMVISQGSSGSDRPFLRAFAATLAALPGDTRAFLRRHHLAAPTLQMIMRRTLKGILRREHYLSGAAHPVVFAGSHLTPERMVAMAGALQPGDVPPMVRIKVVKEDFTDAAGLAGMTERLLDTPSAIARIWRSPDHTRDITISAADTTDPNGRPLTYSWVLLNGDPDKARIYKLDATGSSARLRIDWHDPWAQGNKSRRLTNRVDIGVFANNGVHDSAPAIVSISFPAHQSRTYAPVGQDRAMRLVSIDYRRPEDAPFFDPKLHWYAEWRDMFDYDAQGRANRWTRMSEAGLETLPLSRVHMRQYRLENTRRGPRLIPAPTD